MARKNWKNQKDRVRLSCESLESRWNPVVTSAGFVPYGGGTAFEIVTDNLDHTVHVFSDNQAGASGIHIVALDSVAIAALPNSSASNPAFDAFIPDAQIFMIPGWQGIVVRTGSGNDTIYAGIAANSITVPGPGGGTITYNHNGMNINPLTHKFALADGGDGNDTITGGSGADVIAGGADTDGNPNNNNDYLYGGGGNDTITGGSNNDYIEGNAGNDSLIAGTGNDTIHGGAGQDTMHGGAGWDLVCADTADFAGGVADANVSGNDGDALNNDGDNLPAVGNPVPPRYSQSDFLVIDGGATGGYTNSTFEVIQGGTATDNIATQVSNTNVEIYGNGGNDFIVSRNPSVGNDTIYGGAGNDTLVGGSGNDVMDGDAVNNTGFANNAGFRNIQSCDPNAALPSTGSGNDCLIGGGGNDTLEGGLGNDTLRGGSGTDTLTDAGGIDVLSVYDLGATQGAYVVLGNIPAQPTVVVDGYGNVEIQATTPFEGVEGTFLDDFIQGSTAANQLDGWGGNDTIDGGAGNDTIWGGGGIDSLMGGDGNDFMDGSSDKDYMYGDGGNDVMSGGSGDDEMEGGTGNDMMRGDDGNDVLEGQRGLDTLNGGLGTDTLDGGLQVDTFVIDLGNAATGAPWNVGASPSNDAVTLAGAGSTLNDEIYGGAGTDIFEVWGAWTPGYLSPNNANPVLFADNMKVNDVMSAIFNAASTLVPTTDWYSGIDQVKFNPDFGGSNILLPGNANDASDGVNYTNKGRGTVSITPGFCPDYNDDGTGGPQPN